MKKHNFCAGPCLLPDEVYAKAASAVLDYEGTGLSVLSISHRSDAFIEILEEAKTLALDLLGLQGKGYEVLFLQGGASMEFLRIPLNLLSSEAGYINTGVWSSKAIEQARSIGKVSVVASSEKQGFSEIPILGQKVEHNKLDYLHFTSNNTIYGTQFKEVPVVSCPVVSDMSSDIYSRVFPYEKIDVIYAGAQKNIGPAGLSVVIVKKEIIQDQFRNIPSMLDYRTHVDSKSLYHTANVFGIYVAMLNLRWLRELGGVEEIEKVNNAKAQLLYNTIDSLDFIEGIARKEDRSKMNVTFRLKDEVLCQHFDKACEAAGISNIKGHRVIGGYRASLYNAVSLESVAVLCEVLNSLKRTI